MNDMERGSGAGGGKLRERDEKNEKSKTCYRLLFCLSSSTHSRALVLLLHGSRIQCGSKLATTEKAQERQLIGLVNGEGMERERERERE